MRICAQIEHFRGVQGIGDAQGIARQRRFRLATDNATVSRIAAEMRAEGAGLAVLES